MAMNYKTIILMLLAGLVSLSLLAQGETETRSFMKTVPAGKMSKLELANKYGSIQVSTWDKDSASVRVELKAYATNREKLRKMFDGVTINFTEAKELLKVQTNFTQSISMLFENFKGMTSKYITYDSKMEINYYVYVPDYISLSIDSKYGDVFIEDLTGEASVSVSNGSLKAGNVGRESSFNLSFCDATLGKIATGKITASFSEVTLSDTEDLTVSSVSSKYEIRKAGSLDIDSRRDKFFIDNIGTLKGNSYFTEFRIDMLDREIFLTTRYGNLNAELITKEFKSININSGYTDIELEFDENSSYAFEIRELGSFVVLPSENVRSEQKSINTDKKEYMTFGTYGNTSGGSKVKIDATKGKVYIR
jgi:hypothetical protein